MSKYAIVKNGVVENVILADADFVAGLSGVTAVLLADDSAVERGDLYDGEIFTKPPAVLYVPPQVTMRQARLALLQAGKLDQVATIIAGMPSPQKEAAQIEWEYSQVVERQWALVSALGPALNLTEEQVDQLFITAAAL